MITNRGICWGFCSVEIFDRYGC